MRLCFSTLPTYTYIPFPRDCYFWPNALQLILLVTWGQVLKEQEGSSDCQIHSVLISGKHMCHTVLSIENGGFVIVTIPCQCWEYVFNIQQ